MTAQAAEILFHHGEQMRLFTTPLEPYLESTRRRPRIGAAVTGNWREYVGVWEIDDDRLFLVGLTDWAARAPIQPNEAGIVWMKRLFPGRTGRVLADWFSGELRVPRGERLTKHNWGWASVYEKDLLIQVENGVVTGERVVEHSRAEVENWPY